MTVALKAKQTKFSNMMASIKKNKKQPSKNQWHIHSKIRKDIYYFKRLLV